MLKHCYLLRLLFDIKNACNYLGRATCRQLVIGVFETLNSAKSVRKISRIIHVNKVFIVANYQLAARSKLVANYQLAARSKLVANYQLAARPK